jgi:queuine tRNA-ribosyltransferase
LPTALAKQGVAFTSLGRRDLRRAAYAGMEGPIDPNCRCYTCKTYSIAYLFHLNRIREAQGWQLLGLHNIHFYLELMRTMRQHILADTWTSYYHAQRDVLDARDSYGEPATHVTKAQRRQRNLKLGRYEVVVSGGIGRIRETASGEVMHSVNDPAEEARSLYVEQSRLVARLEEPVCEPLVIWDVGLGAAANAMAAIQAVESARAPCAASDPIGAAAVGTGSAASRRLHLVSFENDVDSLKLALRHPAWFKHLRHPAPPQLLATDRWSNAAAAIDWQLIRGDFSRSKFTAPPPDLIFFDPFSFKTDTGLWSLEAFRELAELLADRAVELFTYTYSTSVRAAMLAAGFYVAKGRGTGPKAETTIALSAAAAAAMAAKATGPAREQGRELLGQDWLGKWRRSDAQAPVGSRALDESWRAAIDSHPQFR